MEPLYDFFTSFILINFCFAECRQPIEMHTGKESCAPQVFFFSLNCSLLSKVVTLVNHNSQLETLVICLKRK